MGKKVLILEDEEDILFLYRDYLSLRGYQIVSCCLSECEIENFEKNQPDICLIDYILCGKRTGIDAAIYILNNFPLMPILFITGFESMSSELSKYPSLLKDNIQILIKPVKLLHMENTMISMLRNT